MFPGVSLPRRLPSRRSAQPAPPRPQRAAECQLGHRSDPALGWTVERVLRRLGGSEGMNVRRQTRSPLAALDRVLLIGAITLVWPTEANAAEEPAFQPAGEFRVNNEPSW
jgi:hypothetical protein